jgi:hypothetical protein
LSGVAGDPDSRESNLSTEKKTGWRSLPRNVWVVTAGSFLTDISSEMIVYLIPFSLPMCSRADIGHRPDRRRGGDHGEHR